ncbi:hypothetical protein VSDG_09261 [Cytospora chrysosperma]|uniref:Prefoldin subunit 6 n=1 Tax=Cytospora chrysosperma TaxID=252740 RepID=A0A423VBG8_CYTCH|nr:hypothetical protein VSDG_09261 [Valsa sordida]
MADAQAKLHSLSEDFTQLQTEMQTLVASRQKLEAQKQENLGVQKEFATLKDGEVIYKMVGPALLKQEKFEAESTVNGRLEFIAKEIDRQEGQIKEVQEKVEKIKGEIISIQSSAQAAGAAPAAGVKA